jgi:serine/threonine-protein kinase
LLGLSATDGLEPYLRRVGEAFRTFRQQDSGCVSYGVRLPGGERWFGDPDEYRPGPFLL